MIVTRIGVILHRLPGLQHLVVERLGELDRDGHVVVAVMNLQRAGDVIQVDMSYQIDNMEGLDVWRRDDGALIVSLVSDDNHSILQRNLYLEFKLLEE